MRNILTLAALLSTAGIASAQPRPPADMLAERVAALEARVTALEQRAGPQAAQALTPAPQAAGWPAWASPVAASGAFGYAAPYGDDAGACANGSCGSATAGQPVRGFFRGGGFFRRGR